MTRTVGSLCTGTGGLDAAVCAMLGGRVVWVSDVSSGAVKLAAYRWPDVPNLGDITKVNWHSVPSVDVICGGTPCQDMSSAGLRAGMIPGSRSGLWDYMREAVRVVQPGFVVWENVSGCRSARAWSAGGVESGGRCVDGVGGNSVLRALGRVLGDLAGLGFDAEWRSVRASDVGHCHRRERLFVVARHADRVSD